VASFFSQFGGSKLNLKQFMKNKAHALRFYHAFCSAMYFGREAGMGPYMCRVSGCGELRYLDSKTCTDCVYRNWQVSESDSHSSDSEDEHSTNDDEFEPEAPPNAAAMGVGDGAALHPHLQFSSSAAPSGPSSGPSRRKKKQKLQESGQTRQQRAEEMVRSCISHVDADAIQQGQPPSRLAFSAAAAANDSELDPLQWDINMQSRSPGADSAAICARATQQLHRLAVPSGRPGLTFRRDIGSCLACLQPQYKAVQRHETGVTFYKFVSMTFRYPEKATKEFIRWYKLCAALPELARLQVDRWSEVQDVMAGKYLKAEVEAVVKLRKAQLESAQHPNRNPETQTAAQTADPEGEEEKKDDGVAGAPQVTIAAAPELANPSVLASASALPSTRHPFALTFPSRSSPLMTHGAAASTASRDTSPVALSAGAAAAASVSSTHPSAAASHNHCAGPDRFCESRLEASASSSSAAAAAPCTPILGQTLPRSSDASPAASSARVHGASTRTLQAALEECRNLPSSATPYNSTPYRQRLADFCRSRLQISAAFDALAPLLAGVSSGWLGVSMAPDGDCLYHVLGILYGKSPRELKDRIREVVTQQYDSDPEIQQIVRESMREEASNSGGHSEGQLKAHFLSRLDSAWGGSATLSLLAKHPSCTFQQFQVWSVNWEQGGVVALGVVRGAVFHVFVAHHQGHYFLLSRIPQKAPTVHPYVFRNVSPPEAKQFAEWQQKPTSARSPPRDD
jgi:hypothetical protein